MNVRAKFDLIFDLKVRLVKIYCEVRSIFQDKFLKEFEENRKS